MCQFCSWNSALEHRPRVRGSVVGPFSHVAFLLSYVVSSEFKHMWITFLVFCRVLSHASLQVRLPTDLHCTNWCFVFVLFNGLCSYFYWAHSHLSRYAFLNCIYTVPCGPGTYYSAAGPRARCLPCSKNTYQDEHKSTSCKPCPGETLTKSQGSKSVEACLCTFWLWY